MQLLPVHVELTNTRRRRRRRHRNHHNPEALAHCFNVFSASSREAGVHAVPWAHTQIAGYIQGRANSGEEVVVNAKGGRGMEDIGREQQLYRLPIRSRH